MPQSQSPRPAEGGATGSFDYTGITGEIIDDKAARNDLKNFSSATATWKAQQAVTARLHRQWREGHDRAARALSLLKTFGHGMSSNPQAIVWMFSSNVQFSCLIPHLTFWCLLGSTFGEGMAAEKSHHKREDNLRVARLRMPSSLTTLNGVDVQDTLPVFFERASLARLQHAFAVSY